MSIEIFAWCSSRELFVTGMTTTQFPDGSTLATLDDNGNLIPHAGVIIDEIGPITKVPAVYDENGDIVTPAVIVDGHHVNLVATGEIATMLTMGCPETGTIFERTNILSLIPGMVLTPIPGPGVPGGYEGPNGVCLYDPAVVHDRARVWL